MGTLIPLKKVDFYSPAVFLIEVKGKIDKSFSDMLGTSIPPTNPVFTGLIIPCRFAAKKDQDVYHILR